MIAQYSLMNWLLWQQWMTYLQSFNFKNVYIRLPKSDISLAKICWTVFEIFNQNPRKVLFFPLSHFDDVIKSTWHFCQFVKISTHSIFLPSFIVTWLEIAKLRRGAKSLFRLAKSPVQIGLNPKQQCHRKKTSKIMNNRVVLKFQELHNASF